MAVAKHGIDATAAVVMAAGGNHAGRLVVAIVVHGMFQVAATLQPDTARQEKTVAFCLSD